ncbi:MAG: metal ABC transporter ATP-binding protein [Aestuariivita sp.]|nr:metal ABC transporter ATP-binding protein [Aestuariivita sp.]MCY4201805.1 metal ABC transporter ATP-binding protein [Aestuariivita sp.]
MKLIETRRLGYAVNGEEILTNIDFAIREGEIVTIVGPNGSGKTSLLRALIGAIEPTSGQVTREKNLRIGYVPQKLGVDQTLPLTVGRLLSLPTRKSRDHVNKALKSVGADGLQRRQVVELSGGQLQRVLLARALINRPQLLVLDEATQGLDQEGQSAFFRIIAKKREELNCGVVMVSHDLHIVMSASDRVVCLNRHICCQGTPEAVTFEQQWQDLFGVANEGMFALYRHKHQQDSPDQYQNPTAVAHNA